MDWDKLKTKFDIYNFFSREGVQFHITRYDSWNDKTVVIANSSNHEILNQENSISMDLEVSDDTWTLVVGFDDVDISFSLTEEAFAFTLKFVIQSSKLHL